MTCILDGKAYADSVPTRRVMSRGSPDRTARQAGRRADVPLPPRPPRWRGVGPYLILPRPRFTLAFPSHSGMRVTNAPHEASK